MYVFMHVAAHTHAQSSVSSGLGKTLDDYK